jgi:hypothetical protein
MRSQNSQVKEKGKLYFCTLCSFIASSSSELDFHYKMAHEDSDDEISELEFEKIRKELAYDSYLRICKSGACIIRRHIDLENEASKIKHLLKEYCLTCVSYKFIVNELKKEGKI